MRENRICIDCFITNIRPDNKDISGMKIYEHAEECPICGRRSFLTDIPSEYDLSVYREYFLKQFAEEGKCVNLTFETLQTFCKRHTMTYSVKEKCLIHECHYVDLDTMEFHEHLCNKENCPYVNEYK